MNGVANHVQFLMQWMAMWDFSKKWKLSKEHSKILKKTTPPKADEEIPETDPNVGVWQIRLLVPGTYHGEEHRQVLVAGWWNAGAALVIPLSLFSVPADNEEICINRGGFPSTTTFQTWNYFILPVSFLKRTWLSDTVESAEHRECISEHLRCIISKVQPPFESKIRKMMGCPIVVDDDPRREYRQQETEVYDPIRNLPIV